MFRILCLFVLMASLADVAHADPVEMLYGSDSTDIMSCPELGPFSRMSLEQDHGHFGCGVLDRMGPGPMSRTYARIAEVRSLLGNPRIELFCPRDPQSYHANREVGAVVALGRPFDPIRMPSITNTLVRDAMRKLYARCPVLLATTPAMGFIQIAAPQHPGGDIVLLGEVRNYALGLWNESTFRQRSPQSAVLRWTSPKREYLQTSNLGAHVAAQPRKDRASVTDFSANPTRSDRTQFQSNSQATKTIGFLKFPLDCADPRCAERYRNGPKTAGMINSILDHSMRRNAKSGAFPYGLPVGDGADEIVGYDGEHAAGPIFDGNCLGGSIRLPVGNGAAMTNSAGCKGQPGYAAYDDHPGYDYRAALGTPVMAAAAGRVLNLNGQRCYIGNMGSDCAHWGFVGIDHGNGYVSQYGHLSRVLVRSGDDIIQGQLIGYSGATAPQGTAIGPHLHFEMWRIANGKFWLVDPYGWSGVGADPLYGSKSVPSMVLWAF